MVAECVGRIRRQNTVAGLAAGSVGTMRMEREHRTFRFRRFPGAGWHHPPGDSDREKPPRENIFRIDFQPVLQIQNFFVPLRTRKVRETDYNKLN